MFGWFKKEEVKKIPEAKIRNVSRAVYIQMCTEWTLDIKALLDDKYATLHSSDVEDIFREVAKNFDTPKYSTPLFDCEKFCICFIGDVYKEFHKRVSLGTGGLAIHLVSSTNHNDIENHAIVAVRTYDKGICFYDVVCNNGRGKWLKKVVTEGLCIIF